MVWRWPSNRAKPEAPEAEVSSGIGAGGARFQRRRYGQIACS
jgi:hypothetical protein